jgi:hypothetical protein
MAKAAPKPKFTILGKSQYVHVTRTKAWDLKNSQCQQVRKYQVADNVPKKGMSPEAASALEPCLRCDTSAVIKEVMPVTEADRKAKKDELLDKFRPVDHKKRGRNNTRELKAKTRKSEQGDKAPKEPRAPKATMVGVRSTGSGERDKAEALLAFAEQSGWGGYIQDGDPGLLVVLKNGEEVIHCWFVDGKYDEARPAQLHVGSWTGKLRGVHMCRRQMAGEGRARPYPNPGQGRSGPRRKDEDDLPQDKESPVDARRRVPFSVDDDDLVIIDAIKGKTIKWRNMMSNTIDSAWLPAEAKGKKTDKIFIREHPKTKERMVTFLQVMAIGEHGEVYGPTRTVLLNKINRVIG